MSKINYVVFQTMLIKKCYSDPWSLLATMDQVNPCIQDTKTTVTCLSKYLCDSMLFYTTLNIASGIKVNLHFIKRQWAVVAVADCVY